MNPARQKRIVLWESLEKVDFDMLGVMATCDKCDSTKNIRKSKSGMWCKNHWVCSTECATEGCNEPMLKAYDGGDGVHCRECLMPTELNEAERYAIMYRSKPSRLAEAVSEDTGSMWIDPKKLTKWMRKHGIRCDSFVTQASFYKKEKKE